MAKPKFIFSKIVLIIILILAFLVIPNFKKGYGIHYSYSGMTGCSKAVLNLTEVIKEGISFNTNDTNEKLFNLKDINEEAIEFLRKNYQLSEDWPFKTAVRASVIERDKCKYHISGDLAKDWFIYCEYHGSINYEEDDGNGGITFVYYRAPNIAHCVNEREEIDKNGKKITRSSSYDGKHDINKAKIPPSKDYYRDERNKKIREFFDDYGLLIGIIIAITITIFK